MWYLVTYEKGGKKPVATTGVPTMTLDVVRRIWGGSDAELLGLTLEVNEARAPLVAPYLPIPLRLDAFDYFIEFTREEKPSSRPSRAP
ncbi:MAG: hypothetical protein M3P38_05035 [Chloroflexota bacterium]|nr:hypothetical protein [Chloroflexota bacterium]